MTPKQAWNKFLTREYSWMKYLQVCKENKQDPALKSKLEAKKKLVWKKK